MLRRRRACLHRVFVHRRRAAIEDGAEGAAILEATARQIAARPTAALITAAALFGALAPKAAALEGPPDGAPAGAPRGEVVLQVPGTDFRAAVPVPPTGGRYVYDAVRHPLADAPAGVRELRVTLRGPVRLHRLDFASAPGQATP